MWNYLISHVTTPYVYIARDVTHMTNATQLTRLIGYLHNHEATVAASAWRTLKSGKVRVLS